MAALPPNERKLARRLAELTVEHGQQGLPAVMTVLRKQVEGLPSARRKPFLRLFLRYARQEARAHELLIEHAGPLDPKAAEALRKTFSERSGKSLTVRTKENPDLLVGLRLTLGDTVYDASAAARLRSLVENVQ